MSTPLAIATNVTSYATRTPYLTPEEYAQAPTAVDTSNVVQGGSIDQQAQQVLTLISRASSLADEVVFGQQGCLAATRDVDGPKRCRINRYGMILFKPRYHPVLEVDEVLIGMRQSTMVALAAGQAIDLTIEQTGRLEIPAYGSAIYAGQGYRGSYSIGSEPLVQVTYVNGYANTTIAAAAAAASSITPKSVLGFYPGASYTIYDTDTGNESVTVAANYVVGAAVVPLAAPLLFAHAGGISISALPGTVKQAVTLIMSALVKTRGSIAIVRGKLQSSPTKTTKTDTGAADYLDSATSLLEPFRRVSLT